MDIIEILNDVVRANYVMVLLMNAIVIYGVVKVTKGRLIVDEHILLRDIAITTFGLLTVLGAGFYALVLTMIIAFSIFLVYGINLVVRKIFPKKEERVTHFKII